MISQWIVPFTGRNKTGVYGQNFLWRSRNLFVMDNHRAAAWCWPQCVDPTAPHSLVHIDRHNDTLKSQLGTWLSLLPHGIPSDINEYLSMVQQLDFGGKAPLFRWDNYLSIYLGLYGANVADCYFATHGEGDRPNHNAVSDISVDELPEALISRLMDVPSPVILNLDLDYFFGPDDTQDEDERAIRILDDAYIDSVTSAIAALDAAGKLSVITIALTATDDLTDGWAPVEAIATRVCAGLGHKFELPA